MGWKVKALGARTLGLLLAASLAAGPIAAQDEGDPCYVDGQRIPETQGRFECDKPRDGIDPATGVLIGVGVVAGVAILGELFGGGGGGDWVSPKELDANGPRFPERQTLGRFEVQGYARGGWPVVLDLETQPGTTTWLEVAVKGREDPVKIDIPSGEGRRVEVVQLPGATAADVQVARFEVHSAVARPAKKKDYRPLQIYALGAGPYAVGSTTLDVTSFEPRQAHASNDLRYALESRRLFSNAAVEVLRLPQKGNKLTRVGGLELRPLTQGVRRGNGAELRIDPRAGSGIYHLQARAWRVSGNRDERDWTGAIAPNYVIVR